METTLLARSGTKSQGIGFDFPIVVDSTVTFNGFRAAIYAKYPWGMYDAVEFRFWDQDKTVWVPLQCDDELAVMFAANAQSRSANVETTVIQRSRPGSNTPSSSKKSTGAGSNSSRGKRASASSRCNPAATSTANNPNQPAPTQIFKDPIIVEAEPDDVLGSDEEDDRMFPDLMPKRNAEQQDEDFIPAEFSDTEDEEEEENREMGSFENDDEDRPEMMYDRENPSIAEGVVFPSALDCRNAVATFSIQHEVEFKILKSDPTRFSVYCAFPRCRWRLHASVMRNCTLFQVLTI